jgi:hypothetical protein
VSATLVQLWCPLCKREHSAANPPSLPSLCVECVELPPLERFLGAAGELDRLEQEGWLSANLSGACGTIALRAARELLRERDREDARRQRARGGELARATAAGERAGLRRAGWILHATAERFYRQAPTLLSGKDVTAFFLGVIQGMADRFRELAGDRR